MTQQTTDRVLDLDGFTKERMDCYYVSGLYTFPARPILLWFDTTDYKAAVPHVIAVKNLREAWEKALEIAATRRESIAAPVNQEVDDSPF